ncbi:MAG: LysM peptidoglycan-binding domain-containing protein [Clostridia bacterium]|nr:LysM peptidoglycan-binding domain-containing protein [Clostridia bacterium]
MVIKDKKKFVRAILLILTITIGILFLISTNTFSHQEIKYKNIAVIEGDTLWDIAKSESKNNSYYKGQDIRDIVENIKEINNLKTSNLKLGQTLEIATY